MSILKQAIISSAKGPVQKTGDDTFTRTYQFSPDFIGFSGHFPGYPILPAFIQILAGLTMAEEIKERPLELLTIEKAKFHIEIHPGNEIEARCQETVLKGRAALKVTLATAKGIAASFLLAYTEA